MHTRAAPLAAGLGKAMNVALRTAVTVCAVSLPLCFPSAAWPEPPSSSTLPQRTIRVTGEGRVSTQPDIAVVSIGVEALASNVSAATADASQRMRAVLDALGKEGVPAKDVRTSQYSVSEERSWKDGKPGPVTGYRVSNTAEVRVRDLAVLGPVLEHVTRAGANIVGALQLEREDPLPEQLQALRAAYAAARAKAQVLAKAAGAELGEVLSVHESSGQGPRPMRRAVMAEVASNVPIAEGELSYTAQVEAVFAFR